MPASAGECGDPLSNSSKVSSEEGPSGMVYELFLALLLLSQSFWPYWRFCELLNITLTAKLGERVLGLALTVVPFQF